MTGLLHEKEFSRKTFVKGGGAMIDKVTFEKTSYAPPPARLRRACICRWRRGFSRTAAALELYGAQ